MNKAVMGNFSRIVGEGADKLKKARFLYGLKKKIVRM